MIEIKVSISAPELTDALNNLADALRERPSRAVPALEQFVELPPEIAAQDAPEAAQSLPEPEAQNAADPAPVEPSPVKPADPVPSEPSPVKPVDPAPAPAEPAKPPKITLDAISRAGTALLDEGKMTEVMDLVKRYGVRTIVSLPADKYDEFAADLRALGASI